MPSAGKLVRHDAHVPAGRVRGAALAAVLQDFRRRLFFVPVTERTNSLVLDFDPLPDEIGGPLGAVGRNDHPAACNRILPKIGQLFLPQLGLPGPSRPAPMHLRTAPLWSRRASSGAYSMKNLILVHGTRRVYSRRKLFSRYPPAKASLCRRTVGRRPGAASMARTSNRQGASGMRLSIRKRRAIRDSTRRLSCVTASSGLARRGGPRRIRASRFHFDKCEDRPVVPIRSISPFRPGTV